MGAGPDGLGFEGRAGVDRIPYTIDDMQVDRMMMTRTV
jgi:hypothetical protein